MIPDSRNNQQAVNELYLKERAEIGPVSYGYPSNADIVLEANKYLHEGDVTGLQPGDFFVLEELSQIELDHVLDCLVKAGCTDTRNDVNFDAYLFVGWEEDTNEIEAYDEPLHFSDTLRLLTFAQLTKILI